MENCNSPKEAYNYLFFELTNSVSEREATNILKIFFQDLFNIHNPKSLDDWYDSLDAQKCNLYAARLIDGEPIQYITAVTNFFGYHFKVNRHVLIPRPETEELVNWILEDLQKSHKQLDVLDVGTGSGCIAITLKLKKPALRMFAIDENLDTLNVARINAKRLDAMVQCMKIDFTDKELWESIIKVDILVSNPPYITQSEKKNMTDSVIHYEPDLALFVDDQNPLLFYSLIAEFAKTHLKKNGSIYLELNEFRASDVCQLFEDKGYKDITLKNDMQGKSRMLRVRR